MKGHAVVDAPARTPHLLKILESILYAHQWCIKQQRKLAKGSDLQGMGPAASVKLMEDLRKAGVPQVHVAAGNGHMAVIVADRVLADPTICQFTPGTAVFVGDPDSFLLPAGYLEGAELFSSRKALVAWMSDQGMDTAGLPK